MDKSSGFDVIDVSQVKASPKKVPAPSQSTTSPLLTAESASPPPAQLPVLDLSVADGALEARKMSELTLSEASSSSPTESVSQQTPTLSSSSTSVAPSSSPEPPASLSSSPSIPSSPAVGPSAASAGGAGKEKLDDKAKLAFLKKEYLKLRDDYGKLQTAKQQSDTETAALKTEVERLRGLKDTLELVSRELDTLKQNNVILKEQNNQLQISLRSTEETAERVRSTLQREVSSLHDTLNEVEKENEALTKREKELRQSKESLEEQVGSLTKTNSELERSIQVLVEKMSTMSESIRDAEYYSTVTRPVRNTQNDSLFRSTFKLPDVEFSIVSYRCFYQSMTTPGILHISPSFLCFQTSLPFSDFKEVLPLRDVRSVVRTRHAKIFDRALELHLVNGSTVHFLGFRDRDMVYSEILQQASKFGLSLGIPSSSSSAPGPAAANASLTPSPSTPSGASASSTSPQFSTSPASSPANNGFFGPDSSLGGSGSFVSGSAAPSDPSFAPSSSPSSLVSSSSTAPTFFSSSLPTAITPELVERIQREHQESFARLLMENPDENPDDNPDAEVEQWSRDGSVSLVEPNSAESSSSVGSGGSGGGLLVSSTVYQPREGSSSTLNAAVSPSESLSDSSLLSSSHQLASALMSLNQSEPLAQPLPAYSDKSKPAGPTSLVSRGISSLTSLLSRSSPSGSVSGPSESEEGDQPTEHYDRLVSLSASTM